MPQKPTIADSNKQDQFSERNDFFNIIYARKSVRKYLGIPVEWEKITKVIESARVGPSAGNLQPVKYLVVQDQKKRTQISSACLEQHWMSMAPVHIVVSVNPENLERYYGEKGKQRYAIQDGAMAGMAMMLAATSLKLGSCWVSLFQDEKIKEILNLRKEEDIQGVLALGYSAEDRSEKPVKKRIESVTSIESRGPPFVNFADPFELKYRFKERIPKYLKKTYQDFKTVREHNKSEDSEKESIIDKIKKKFKK